MKKLFYTYSIVFLLEVMGIVPGIYINQTLDLKITILFEIVFFIASLRKINKVVFMLNRIKGLRLLIGIFIIGFLVTVSTFHFFNSMILSLRLLLILCTAFIPVAFNFSSEDLKLNFRILDKILLVYAVYIFISYFVLGYVGQRYFGPMGDSFPWMLSVFATFSYLNKKYKKSIFYLIIMLAICGSIICSITFVLAVVFNHFKKGEVKKILFRASFLFSLLVLFLFFFPNLIFETSIFKRFNYSSSNNITSYENSKGFKEASFVINIRESLDSFIEMKGTGSASFTSNEIGSKYNLGNGDIYGSLVSLPTLEVFRVIREWGIYGLIVYLIFIINILRDIWTSSFFNNKEIEFIAVKSYFFIYVLFSFLIFQPGSIMYFLFVNFLGFYFYSKRSNYKSIYK